MSVQLEAEQQARIAAHMKLFGRFMDMVTEDPSITDEIPAGAYVFFLPEDDPEQAERERRGAESGQAGLSPPTTTRRAFPGGGSSPASLAS